MAGRTSSGSEVVIMDERAMAAAASAPTVGSVNVSRFSRLHIGPRFISVTQNVQNTEVIKGQILGLELETPKDGRKLRCSIAVFVCWSIVVASGCAVYFVKNVLSSDQERIDLGIHTEWYLRRADWRALPPYKQTFLELPVQHVIIGHSAGSRCVRKYNCIEQVLDIQRDHLLRRWDDIGPNFLVGAGYVFEGRGANMFGSMVKSWNYKIISIMFLGDYRYYSPTKEEFDRVNIILQKLIELKILREDYILYGHCQVRPLTISPGPNIMQNMRNFTHWSPVNASLCLNG